MIELSDFSIGYGSRKLLSNANASIADGRLTALIGRNGTGKSTLLRALAGISSRYSGEIKINGHNIRTLPGQELSRMVAFVNTERIRIPNLSCADVVGLGRSPYTDWIGRLSEADRAIVDRSLDAVGMAGYSHRTMDTMSDGECQRVMIARALAQDTSVLLLDEPTSFLDMPARYELVALLRRLAEREGKCVLFSTHELDIALRMCHDIVLIDSPSLRCLPAEEMQRSGYLERLFGSFLNIGELLYPGSPSSFQ